MVQRLSTRILATATLAATLLLAGCLGGAAPDPAASPPAAPGPASPAEIRIVASDHAFVAPATVEAGLVEVTLENVGAEIHHVTFYRLDAGRTLADLREALVEGKSATPSWATAYGGPNVALPGAPTKAVLALDPGEYVLACVIPSMSDHVMHAAKGMLASLSVVPAAGPAAQPPAPDATATLGDFSFDLDAPLAAGPKTLRVVNEGTQTHELGLFELFGDATPTEFLQAMEDPNATAPPPGRPVGGATPMSPGKEVLVPLDLTPGRYFAVCFDVTGSPHGEPHFVLGMLHEFEVA